MEDINFVVFRAKPASLLKQKNVTYFRLRWFYMNTFKYNENTELGKR